MMTQTLIETAFALNGPVHQSYLVDNPSAKYRAPQAKGAKSMWETMMRGEKSPQTVVALHEIWTGLGKTLMEAVCCAFYVCETGNRALIAVPTISEREVVIAHQSQVNTIIEKTYEIIGKKPNFEFPVKFAQFESAMSYMSPTMVWEIRKQWTAGLFVGKREKEVGYFLDFIDQCASPKNQTFANYYEYTETLGDEDMHGRLPEGLSEELLRLRPQDRDDAANSGLIDSREIANQSDVLVVTHAMLMRNSAVGGKLLSTQLNSKRVFGTLVIDEADRLPDAANSMSRISVSYMEISNILDDIKNTAKNDPTSQISRQILGLVANTKRSLQFINNKLVIQKSKQYDINANTAEGLREALIHAIRRGTPRGKIGGLLPDLKRLKNSLPPKGMEIAKLRIDDILNKISRLIKLYQERSKKRLLVNVKNGVGTITHENFNNKWCIQSLFKPTKDGGKSKSYSFRSVYMMSATMEGKSGSMQDVKTSLGIEADVKLVPTKAITPNYGKITHLVLPPNDVKYIPFLPSTKGGQAALLNPDHIALVAEAANFAYKMGETVERTLIICGSTDQQLAIIEALKPLHGDRILKREKGEIASHLIKRYSDCPGSILVTMDARGMDLVCPKTKQTLPKSLIVARILRSQNSKLEIVRRGWDGAMDYHSNEAFRNIVQAIGRGIRNADDELRLFIIDPRMPLPPNINLSPSDAKTLEAAGREKNDFAQFYIAFQKAYRSLPTDPLKSSYKLGIISLGKDPEFVDA